MRREQWVGFSASVGLHAALLIGVVVAARDSAVVRPPMRVSLVYVADAREEVALSAAPPTVSAPKPGAPETRPAPVRRAHPTSKRAPVSTPIAAPAPVAVAAAAPVDQVGAAADEWSAEATGRRAEPGEPARPRYSVNPAPEYPGSSRRRREEGLVLLRVRVTSLGRADRVEVAHSSGHSALDEAAVRAVRDWEFEPARIGPVPIECEVEVPVHFTLRD